MNPLWRPAVARREGTPISEINVSALAEVDPGIGGSGGSPYGRDGTCGQAERQQPAKAQCTHCTLRGGAAWPSSPTAGPTTFAAAWPSIPAFCVGAVVQILVLFKANVSEHYLAYFWVKLFQNLYLCK
jgi:hypothetical protein